MARKSKVTPEVHLLVACHGLWGQPLHLRYLVKKLIEAKGGEISPTGAGPEVNDEGDADAAAVSGSAAERDSPQPSLVVLISESNAETKTYDGIDWCAERTVIEIEREKKRLGKQGRRIVKLSILGYSLGGLIARYLAGLLYSRGFFNSIEPISFTTLATPHVGIPRTSGWFSKVAAYVGGRLLGRTGRQIYVRDSGWEAQSAAPLSPKSKASRTLLETMSDPESNFVKALQAFHHVDFYANSLSDITVPIRTGALMDLDPWVGWPEGGYADLQQQGIVVERHPDYPALITSAQIPKSPPAPRSLLSRLASVRWPFWLNPRQVPWPFPLNWILVILFPIAAPVLIGLLVSRLASGTKESNRRVKQLQADWLKGQGIEGLSENGGYTKEHERTRISSVIAETARAMGEDYVEEDPIRTQSSIKGQQNGDQSHDGKQATRARPPTFPQRFSVTPTVRAYLNKKQPQLSAKQAKMQDNLHASLPDLRKHLAYFDGVRNSHAIIICRTPSIEVHRRGKVIIRHFTDHFEV